MGTCNSRDFVGHIFKPKLTELQLNAVLAASLYWESTINKDAVLTEAIRALMEARKGR